MGGHRRASAPKGGVLKAPGLARPPRRNPSLDHPDLQEVRRAERAHLRDLDPFGRRMRRRWLLYVIGSVIFFPLMTWFFTPAGFQALWFQVLASAAYGTYLAHARPTGLTAAVATVGAGLATQAVTDHIAISFALVISIAVYGAVGYVIGMSEYSKIMDGR